MALFLSDLHLGSPLCQAEQLAFTIARNREHSTVYLVGDVFDDVTMEEWPYEHLEVVELLLGFTDIVYLPGNHDAAMRALIGLLGDNITIRDEFYYHARNGKQYLVTHGDKYDWTMMFNLPLWMRRLGKPTGTTGLHGRLFGAEIERRLVHQAKARGCDGVICGHTHVPAHRMVDGIEYINCGDWFTSCTAVIEDEHGLRLIGGNQ